MYEGYIASHIMKHTLRIINQINKTTQQLYPAIAFDRNVQINIKRENALQAHPEIVRNERI
jgi:hypothetical protein